MVWAVAAFEKQTDCVVNRPLAYDGDDLGIRHFGVRLEISAGGLLAARDGHHFLWYRPHRRDHANG